MPETESSGAAGPPRTMRGEKRRDPGCRPGLQLFYASFVIGTVQAIGMAPAWCQQAFSLPGQQAAVSVSSVNAVLAALAVGALSAILLSALWLNRERTRLSGSNAELRAALSEARTELSRHRSLILDKDRCYVVWDGGSPTRYLGSLPAHTGAPLPGADFLVFSDWLGTASAARLERAVASLLSDAEAFDLTLETGRGHLLEAQGRASGAHAFVRFAPLADTRAERAALAAERDRLVAALETLQLLLDAVDMPAWLRDDAGRLTWVNRAYADAVEAQDGADAVRRNLELLGNQSRRSIAAGRTLDKPFHDRLSTVVRGNRTFFAVADAGSPTGSAGIARDIDEIEALREEIARTADSHAETLNHLATPVAIFDAGRRLRFYNQAFQTLWELDTPFLKSRPDHGAFLERLRADGKLPEPPSWHDWKEEILSVYHAVDAEPQLWHLPGGQALNVLANIHPHGGVTWVFDNLTEKYALESRYNTLVKVQGETIDHLSEGVCVFGADGRLRLSNPAFRALWALPEEAVSAGVHINRIAELCVPSYNAPDGWTAFAAFITGGDEARRSDSGRLELHSGLVLDYALVPLPDAETMLTFVNITDSVRVERALTDKNEALQKADALKNAFVKHVSYELRSPLTNIIGFTDLLKTPQIGQLNAQQADYVDHISTSSSLLLTLVNDILDLTTVDAGIMRLDMEHIDIRELIDEVVSLIGARLRENSIALNVELADTIGGMVADGQRLKQILFKLLVNAANFAPERSVVTVSARRESDEIVFSVSDTGPGIPKDVLETVFDRFETHSMAGRRSGGAGLGLSIVDSFVGLHNGSVEVVSDETQGTTVICRLPAFPSAPSQAAE